MGLLAGTPVFGGCDDVQAAAVGAGMCGDGDIHIYLGTSAWVAATSKTADKFRHGAAAIQSADREMNLIAGITESAGANIQWICDQFFASEKRKIRRKHLQVYGRCGAEHTAWQRSSDLYAVDAGRTMSRFHHDDQSDFVQHDYGTYERTSDALRL